MEVYQAPTQAQQHLPQQVYGNPFQGDVEKAGSIHSGHQHQLQPHTYPDANLTHGYNHGHVSPVNPGTPVNYHAGHHGHAGYPPPPPPPPPPPQPPLASHVSTSSSGTGAKEMANREKNGFNVPTKMAVAMLAIIVILFAAVIGLAAGLGMTQESLRQARSDLVLAQAKLVAPGTGTAGNSPPSDSTTPTMPATVTATIVSTPTAQAAIKCPAGNGTFYSSSTSSGDSSGPIKQFQRICGIDYGQGEAKDIGSTKVASLDECMDACAAREGCTGAGWGVITGDKGNMHSCWMKTDLTKPHKATQDWGFGILITGSAAGNFST